MYIEENMSTFLGLTHGAKGTYEVLEDLETAVKDAWLVVEAVTETLSIKESVFHDLEKHAPEDCIFATNSSSYKSSQLLGQLKNETKQRVLNMHYMMPPQVRSGKFVTS